ncbi:MAG: peptidase S41, partial [Parvibaculum sp.]|nr:peptidase S41 [Parvibaculum sp.]
PDIVVHQTDPDERKKAAGIGESSLPGHLASDDGEEVAGSDSFVPKDKADDKQLLYAIDLLNGVRQDAAFLGGRTSSAMAN